jgi:hypothetical protein
MLISDNGISKVWRDGSWVYKKQPKTRTDNEIYALQHLYDTGYVPYAEQVSIDIIKMEDLGQGESVTDPDSFMKHRAIILRMLEEKGLSPERGMIRDRIRGGREISIGCRKRWQLCARECTQP